ncbi:hypothetical protein Daus18300_014176 [Diaporthe australafricana]|uniref:Cytochrome P450 n=1 Tax=Diaporthe australafricana TaxID=127596 RepID=A0ABR3VW81_9PEZI
MDVLLWILLVACILVSRAVSVFGRRQDGSYDTIQRYPHVDPFGIDLMWQIRRDFQRGRLSEGMRLRHVLYGSTFSTKHLWENYIYTIEPENIDAINKDKSENFEKSAWASEAAKHIGNGVLLNEGDAWRRSRAMLNPIFGSSAAEVPTLMEPKVRRLVAQMRALQEKKGAVELHSLIDKFMLDVVTEFLFGKSADCLENPRSPEGEDAIQFLTDVRSFDGPSAKFIAVGTPARLELLASIWRLKKTVASMQGFFRRKLQDIMTSTETASARSPPWSVFKRMKATGIPEDQIQAELQNIFFASWYTTSALLANTIYILLRNQDVLGRLRQEIQPLQGKPPTNQDLRKMEYLGLVLMEGEGGTEPGDGADESHTGGSEIPTAFFTHLPFGLGPRACLGKQMAKDEVSYVIVRLLQEFSLLETKPGLEHSSFREAEAVSFYNADGVWISVK